MKLYLYVWTEHFSDGLSVSWYHSWEQVAWFVDLWDDPSYVFTVILTEDHQEIEILPSTKVRYKFIDSMGEVVEDLFFRLEDIENGKVVEWFKDTGNEISKRVLIIGEKDKNDDKK